MEKLYVMTDPCFALFTICKSDVNPQLAQSDCRLRADNYSAIPTPARCVSGAPDQRHAHTGRAVSRRRLAEYRPTC